MFRLRTIGFIWLLSLVMVSLLTSMESSAEESKTVAKTDQKTITNSIGMKFVPIQPGTFMMGIESGRYDNEPPHQVTLTQGFYMQTTEVTQGQWKVVMADHGTKTTQLRWQI